MYDYVVIGGGIIGTSIARSLQQKDMGTVAVLEKEDAVGQHASGRNSGVIHSGFNLKPGSIKATMCVEGSRRLREYCKQHGVDMYECGTLVIARNEEEEAVLDELKRRGDENAVPDIEIICEKELHKQEPYVNAKAALFSPTGATVDSLGLLQSLVETNKQNGIIYKIGSKVKGIEGNEIQTNNGNVKANHIINCAGLYADKIAEMMGVSQGYKVVPFRGEYFEVDNKNIVNSMVYQAPDLKFPFLKIHLTKETDGRVLAGPSAVLSFGRESYDKQINFAESLEMLTSQNFLRMLVNPSFIRMAYQNFKTSLTQRAFLREINSITPGVEAKNISPHKAGIRAQMVAKNGKLLEDMVVSYQQDSTHVLNAVSPGMTCSLAFGDHVTEHIKAA